MPSSIGHGAAALLLAPVLKRCDSSVRLIAAAAMGAMIPDIDAVGRPFGRGDITWLGGHRAFTHSLLFAVVAGLGIGAIVGRRDHGIATWRAYAYAILVVLSHGVLDAFTTYGDGIAFFSPFSSSRYASSIKVFEGYEEILLLWTPALLMYSLFVKPRLHRSNAGRCADHANTHKVTGA